MFKIGTNKNTSEEPKLSEVQNDYTMPLIITSGLVFGPEVNTAIVIDNKTSLLAVDYAAKNAGLLCFCDQPDSQIQHPELKDLRAVGCISDINNVLKMNEDSVRVGLEGKKRAVIKEIVSTSPFYTAKVEFIDYEDGKVSEDDSALYKVLLDKYSEFLEIINHTDDKFLDELEAVHPEKGIDMIAANIPISANEFYTLMTCMDMTKRLNLAIEYIMMIIKVAKIELDIESKLAESFTEEQKQRYLREKKYIINKELSEDDEDEEFAECRTAIEKLPIGNEYKDRLLKELSRLELTPPDSREASTIMSYFDCILDLPWNKKHGKKFDINKAMEKLEADHYGMKDVKERIVEYLAVLSLTNKIKGPILCLVGPPGVGKTSVAKSIAEATKRKFVRVSLGGMDDEAEIRGHRKTYVGAMPGRIIGGLRQVQSKNPVFLLDEIDKLSKSYSGDPASALLEVLDPEQNAKFTDTYVEVPFDLSDVLFITTANTLNTVPKPLIDRMEVIELSGYTPDEKLEIAKHYLVEKQLKLNGISRENLSLTDEVIYEIISCYTCESGVRELERCIASLCRKAAKALVVSRENSITVTKENLRDYLGKKVQSYEMSEDIYLKGSVRGLAWTSSGGDTLQIEAVTSSGSGKLELTGHLGDIMKESAKASIGYLRGFSDDYGISPDIWEKSDIHIHVPEGAVPKDGPSAGITITSALLSAILDKPVSQKIAMTGEITLTGRVLPIGGLREKLLAAKRARITKVIIPSENKEDLRDVPDNVRSGLDICFAEKMRDVYNQCFGPEV